MTLNKGITTFLITIQFISGSANLKRPGSNQSPADEAKRIKTYQCEACDKWFTSSGHLKRHFNTTLHKNATRHQHKSGGSPRIGTPSGTLGTSMPPGGPHDPMLGGTEASNSISNLNTTTSTLNSSPSPSSPHPGGHPGGTPGVIGGPLTPGGPTSNNNVPNSPRSAFYNSSSSRNSSPMAMGPGPPGGQPQGVPPGVNTPSPAKNNMMNMNMLPNTMRPLPSMKESLSHIKDEQEPWGQSGMNPGAAVNQQQQIIQQQRQGYSLYSPDSVSAVNR